MTPDEIKERGEALRKKLADERNGILDGDGSISPPGATAGNLGQAGNGRARSGDTSFAPTGGQAANRDRQSGSDRSSTRGRALGSRWSRGWSEEGDGGPALDPAATEQNGTTKQRVGRLETDESILEPINLNPDAIFAQAGQDDGPISPKYTRIDFRPITRGQFKGQYAHKADWRTRLSSEEWLKLDSGASAQPGKASEEPKANRFRSGHTLSEAEARDLFEPFTATLIDFGGYADRGLWLYAPQADGMDIWGNLTTDEAEQLAKPLLKWGQRSPEVAFAIRTSIDIKDYAALLAILGPRINLTVKVMREVPRHGGKRRKFSFFRTGGQTVEADPQRAQAERSNDG